MNPNDVLIEFPGDQPTNYVPKPLSGHQMAEGVVQSIDFPKTSNPITLTAVLKKTDANTKEASTFKVEISLKNPDTAESIKLILRNRYGGIVSWKVSNTVFIKL